MTLWADFFRKEILELLQPGHTVIDIGGGLRALPNRGNRYDPEKAYLLEPLQKTHYKILDPVSDYDPDIVGDIHALPLEDRTVDAVICIAVLEHVEDPVLAMAEMYRVLKPGGRLFVYVPFLYYYHAEVGYYKDYWRFTKDALALLAKNFSSVEWCPVRGAVETWIHLSPLGRIPYMPQIARLVDRMTGKSKSVQVSGYYGILIK